MTFKEIVVFCFFISVVRSATDLEIKCNASTRPSIFLNGNCFIAHTEFKQYNQAKMSCIDIIGFYGHLTHIRSWTDANKTEILMAAGSGDIGSLGFVEQTAAGNLQNVWIGTEYYGAVGPYATGWYYTTPTRKFNDNATFIPWASANGVGSSMIYRKTILATAVGYASSYQFICQYEQQYAHPITAAELYCRNITTATWQFYYEDGSCFVVIYPPFFIPTTVAALRNSCPKVTGLVTRTAHANTTAKTNLMQSFGRLWDEIYGATPLDNYYWVLGAEQLKACPANTCSEEGSYSWFWTTPEGYKWPANTMLSGFWGTGYPTDTASERNYANFYGQYYGIIDITIYNNPNALICEYRDPYSFSNFEKACLLSSNPSAPGYSSCFTMVRNATNFTAAQTSCTEFPGGYLARVNSIELGTFISSALWATTGLPPSMPLFTGLRQFPVTGADEPDKQWNWMYPDGTKALANSINLPWNTSQPVSAGDCGSISQNGRLIATNCSTKQWFLCQYPNPLYRNYNGLANVKGAFTISETNNVPLGSCQQSCLTNGECTSFAYQLSPNNACQLIGGSSSSSPGYTISSPGYTWFNLSP